MSSAPAAARFDPRLALLVAAAFFMEFLDGTVLVTAIPSIAADFRSAAADVGITMTAYVVTVAVGIPVSGWLAQRFGARRIFSLAVAVFTTASLLCALSPSLPLLTAARVLQGAGGAMMVPVGTLAVLRGTPKQDLLRATAFLVWPGLLAPVLAPVVGGVFTTYLSWHWIFLINLPPGAVAFAASLRLVPAGGGDGARRLDWRGLMLTMAGVGAVVIGLELAAGPSAPGLSALLLVGGAAALAAAVRSMRRTAEPLFDLDVFGARTFRATSTGGFVYRLTISAVPFLLPLLFQTGFGWNPLHAGAMVAALFLGNIAIKPATTPIIVRWGFKPVLVFASLASAGTFAACAFLTAATPEPLVFVLLAASGAFRSIGFSAYASVQYADVDGARMPSANVLSATLAQLAAGTGIAVGALSLRLFGAGVHAAEGPFRGAFLTLAVLMLLSTADSLALPRHAGAAVTGKRTRGRGTGPEVSA